MAVLLECLIVLLENLNLFDISSWFDLNPSRSAETSLVYVQKFTSYIVTIIRASIVLSSNGASNNHNHHIIFYPKSDYEIHYIIPNSLIEA